MEEKLREILEKNKSAYNMTEFIPANGKNLDYLAAARQEMRNIHKTISDMLEGLNNGGENGR